MGDAVSSPAMHGKVTETMNAGSYTYIQLDDGGKKIWAAGPQSNVAVGDEVSIPSGMVMEHFQSKTLGRTFDRIYFVDSIEVAGKSAGPGPASAHAQADGSPHGDLSGMTAPDLSDHTKASAGSVDLTNIQKADGGQTIAELFANKATLVGKEVRVRGRVIKYTPSVMGKNWLHLADGSGSAGTNDLAVSTSGEAAVGKTVLVRGKLGTDKDLGFGYHYDVIIEDATVTVE